MPSTAEDDKITAFLEDVLMISPEKHAIITEVRALFKAEMPDIEEKIKYGGLAFFIGDEICGGLFASKHHVSMEMSNGSWLNDSKGVLEGKGKTRRHLKLRNRDDIVAKTVAKFVALTLKAATSQNGPDM